MKKTTSTRSVSAKVDLLVTMFNDLNAKITSVDKSVKKNAEEIEDLKKSINMGKGSIRTLVILGGLVGALYTSFKMMTGQT